MSDGAPKMPTPVKTKISKEIGTTWDKSGCLPDTNSDKKLEVKAPIRNKIVKIKKVIAAE